MYRLLIVDDERYLVESIYELISAQSEDLFLYPYTNAPNSHRHGQSY